jgi:muramoyltetrapeptide carboxypeptidase
MPSGLHRADGAASILRGLDWLVTGQVDAIADEGGGMLNLSPPLFGGRHKQVAFNLTVFSQLLGTRLEPDLTDHILMLEDVAEYMYRLDRSLFHITSSVAVRRVAGIKLGRCSEIPDNDPPFAQTEEEITQHWCAKSGIAYLGRADIGHDGENKVVPFG